MEDKDFNSKVTKLIREIICAEENITLEDFIEKYDLPDKLKRKIKRIEIKWTLTDVFYILDILNIKVGDFFVAFENKYGNYE